MVYSRGAALPFRRPISFTMLVQNIEQEAFYFFFWFFLCQVIVSCYLDKDCCI